MGLVRQSIGMMPLRRAGLQIRNSLHFAFAPGLWPVFADRTPEVFGMKGIVSPSAGVVRLDGDHIG